MSPFVSIEDLAISYHTGPGRPPTHVVHDISLDVDLGSTLAIVGESGSGKSTVARTLLGYLRPGSFIRGGTVHVDGEDVFALSGSELRALRGGTVALVAQNAGQALTPSMRCGAQIAEALTVHGGAASEEKVHELLEQVALPSRLARSYPHELSGGQQQRVAIAMAVAARPKVLVLDEPTTALDVVTQAGVLRLLRDLTAELNTATLLVSHDLGVVAGMADDVLVMQEGRKMEHAPSKRLFRRPGDDYTRMLLASAPRIGDDGLVEIDDDGTRRIRPRAELGDSDVIVRGEDVQVTYGRGPKAVRAVAGVDIEVKRGEVVALVGESGSGKSTLAWAVAGLTPPSGGELEYLGDVALEETDVEPTAEERDLTRPVRRRPLGLRRRIQLVFQNADTALNPRLSVGTSIKRPLQLFKTAAKSDAGRRTGELLEQVELPADFAGRLPGQLSGGQRQRIGIARALAGDPTVIIADEITTALDVSVQASVLRLLDDIRREEQLACIFISHDLAVVRGIADRVLVMQNALVVEEGPTEAVFSDPQHPYTKELLTATLVAPAGADDDAGPEDEEWIAVDPLAEAGGERTWQPDAQGGWNNHGDGHRSRAWLPID
ncbi:MAG: ABC transporter ATP-binding protein [Propionibacterium sp.]|nr:ABC transporter ATP-binding protein [Propionibacterium sp.]